ncbi:putative tricarboxylic transport membrane protein [Melghirimyces profundicolus]|uniref:Putative tricarboxylic transport membrane protein n=1 Tax=Melghirimyces profundicolus TaxID=1242148 RepID=A0A2T6BYZ7_9BACL|nr:tripartite tricarboxylate transporter TctB family protein [Melghirimyces profundicolus]PTX61292.1 putative tricarboxylic transport membrane protein [Melghirimyces profundicolus]
MGNGADVSHRFHLLYLGWWMKVLKTTNQKIALFLIVLSIVYLILSFRLPPFAYVPVDSDVVPISLGFLLLFLSVLLFFKKDRESEEGQSNRAIPKQEILILVAVLLFILLYIFLLERVGFILVTTCFIFVCSWFLGYKKWVINAVVSVLTPILIYYLFTSFLQIELPQGVLPI